MVEAARGIERAIAFERRNGALRRIDGDRAQLAGEGCGEQVGMAEHRLALGKVSDRPDRAGEQVRPEESALRLAGLGANLAHQEAESGGLPLPGPAELVPVDVLLGRPRHQRGAVRQMRAVLRLPHAAFGHRRRDLRPPCREPFVQSKAGVDRG